MESLNDSGVILAKVFGSLPDLMITTHNSLLRLMRLTVFGDSHSIRDDYETCLRSSPPYCKQEDCQPDKFPNASRFTFAFVRTYITASLLAYRKSSAFHH